MLTKQTIVMTSVENDEKKAILTIEKKDDFIGGKLRLYGFSQDPKGIVSLGIYYDGKVEKAGLTKYDNMRIEFPFAHLPTPTGEKMRALESIFKKSNLI